MRNAVKCVLDAEVAHITLTGIKAGNLIGISLLEELTSSLRKAMDDETSRVIVLSAEGSDFCKGLDIEEYCKEDRKGKKRLSRMFLDCLTLIRNCEKPIIACVEGDVMGGGVGLVAACDIVLARGDIIFMLPEAIIGMIPALITPFLLSRLSPARIRYMALSTRGFNAREAMMMGLVDEAAENGMKTALDRHLQRLLCSSPRALAETKKYLECLTAENLNQQKDIAMQQLKGWLDEPDVIANIGCFADGFSPPWFNKYRGKTK